MVATVAVKLVVDNTDQSVVDVAHSLWRQGRDRVAIAGALMDMAIRLTGKPCPDAAIEVLAPVAGRAEARAAVLEALYRRACEP